MADIEKNIKELAVKGRDGKLTVDDLTGGKNSALRWVDDRRGHQGAEDAAVGNSEVTAGQVVYGQLAVAAFHCQLFDILFIHSARSGHPGAA